MDHDHLVAKGRIVPQVLHNNNNDHQSSSSVDQEDVEMMQFDDLRRGPWTVEEDFILINYIALHGEGRWNSLARCAGLKRTGKSCRLRWLNYLRPDVRRGNITLEEQLLILELHSRWGNRWLKIAQHLPGRTDNEIKNYWRTRVQKHAKQLKCDVNSKQFKDTMRYLWMPRLVERIQAAATATATAATTTTGGPSSSSSTTTTSTTTTTGTYPLNHNNMDNVYSNQVVLPQANNNNNNNNNSGGNYQNVNLTPSYTPENSNTTAVSPVSDLTDCYYPVNQNQNQNQDNYFQANNNQLCYTDSLISPCGYYNPGLDFQTIEQSNPWPNNGDISDNLWNAEDIWFLQQQFNNNM